MPVRILIVEDEQIIADDIAGKLTRMGHDVVGIAMAGEEAVVMAEVLRPELILMDIQLEGEMSGTEAAQTIQERSGTPIIFVTAYPGVFLRDPDKMREPGICLSKPFSRLQLEAALKAAIGSGLPGGRLQ